MIFLDTNIWLYATGRAHPLARRAQDILRTCIVEDQPIAASTEVLQEVLHIAERRQRPEVFDRVWPLMKARAVIWPVEVVDVRTARDLMTSQPHLSARDLIHLATCLRRGVDELVTFDRALATAWAHP